MKTLTLGYYNQQGVFHIVNNIKEIAEPAYYVARLSKNGRPYLEVQISPLTASLIWQAQHN